MRKILAHLFYGKEVKKLELDLSYCRGENLLCEKIKNIGDTEGSVFELGNRIYRYQNKGTKYEAMVLVPDGIYKHEKKHAVINDQLLVYYK